MVVRIKISDIHGTALDWAVARAEGKEAIIYAGMCQVLTRSNGKNEFYSPRYYSTDWSLGGAILEREKIMLSFDPDAYEAAGWNAVQTLGKVKCYGPTALIAAMRCYIANALRLELIGEELEIPEDPAPMVPKKRLLSSRG